MSPEWLVLLFDGNQLVDLLMDKNKEINHELFAEWSNQVERFTASNRLTQEQQQVLLRLVKEVERLAATRAGYIHQNHEELIKMYQVSRKYIQSS